MDYPTIPISIRKVGMAAALAAWGGATFFLNEGEMPLRYTPDSLPFNSVVLTGCSTGMEATPGPAIDSNWKFEYGS